MVGRGALVAGWIVAFGVVGACVGDDPATGGAGTPDSGSPAPPDDATVVEDSRADDRDGDADVDAGFDVRPCDLDKPLKPRGALPGIAEAAPELWMDESERDAVVTMFRTDAGKHGLFEAKRAGATAAFQTTGELTTLNDGQARGGALSPDRRTMIFFSERNGTRYSLYTSKRSDPSESFPAPAEQIVPSLESFHTAHPDWIDDHRLLFGTLDEVDPTKNKLYRATWTGSAITSPVEIVELSAYQPTRPSMTAAESIIVFQSQLTKTSRIMEARRGTGVQFGTPLEIATLKTAGGEHPLFLSRNGCRLVYAIIGESKVQWAERAP